MNKADSVDYFANPDKQPLPYIEFEMRPKEGRDDKGQPVYVDVPYVKVTQPGGKDTFEKPFDDWLKTMKDHADAGRIPPHWPGAIKQAHEAWVKGEELPTDGYPIKLWTPLTKSQLKLLLDIKVRTVEELAGANDSLVERIGMGGRALKTMAEDWCRERSGPGAMAAKLLTLEQKVDSANELIQKQAAVIDQLLLLVPADKRPVTPDRPNPTIRLGIDEE